MFLYDAALPILFNIDTNEMMERIMPTRRTIIPKKEVIMESDPHIEMPKNNTTTEIIKNAII